MAEFGVITMATDNDYLKAVGLALSIRKHNPDVEIAIACYKHISDKIGHHFDYVIEQRHDLKGFEHKVHLDEYSPFEKTFFFDADILFFRNLQPIYEQWKGRAYTARGGYKVTGGSTFGLDYKTVLKKIKKEKIITIGGAGHAYFEKPYCQEVFNLARKITSDYTSYANPCKYADEDVMGIAMTILDLPPMDNNDFQARLIHAIPGSIKMDVTKGFCEFNKNGVGKPVTPYMIHFVMREFPFLYRKNLSKIYKENSIHKELDLWGLAFRDWYWGFKTILRGKVKALFKN